MALVIAPEAPFGEWFAALDQQMRGSAGFFSDRPVVADLAAVLEDVGQEAVLVALDGLEARGLKVIGVEGVRPTLLAGTRWGRLPTNLHGRDVARELGVDLAPAAAAEPSEAAPSAAPPSAAPPSAAPPSAATPSAATPSAPSLLIDRPVRSGQSVIFEEGDITIVGAVASGAEVIAGGSIHVYGALRGRAIAGLKSRQGARIFCRKLEAELVGVDRLYRTAEHWGADLHGRAVQVRCDRGALRLSALV
ncbi:septum site-determining protein MinC [Phenylobacterium sp.]|uniref:septum site-determining protein MinC n=1 Tax=Phenylobacterium sp. TaxID=1871053 RepID=UPI00261C9CC6|nr:septum site-determining protein MinC [Phenylobacterium sp.]